MGEEDPSKLAELFEEYRREYQQEREQDEDEARPRKKSQTGHGSREEAVAQGPQQLPSGSADEIRREEMHVDEVAQDYAGEELLEMAPDDVNDIPLPIDEVKKASTSPSARPSCGSCRCPPTSLL